MKHPEIITAYEALAPRLRNWHIATLPYSSNIIAGADGALEPVLSKPSGWSVDAAIAVQQSHLDTDLTVIGETLYGRIAPNTALLMKRRAVAAGVAAGSVTMLANTLSEEPLNNTSLQMEALAESLGTSGEGVLAVAMGYHIRRVATHAGAYGLKDMVYVPAEYVLELVGQPLLSDPYYRAFNNGVESSECLLRVLASLDPYGSLLFNPLTRKRGPRVVDAVDGPGGITFINTTASARYAAVAAVA